MQDDASRELVRSAAQGDVEARRTLLACHLDGLRAYVRLRLGEALRAKESSGDIVQAVCLDVLGDIEDYDYRGEAAFRHWLYTRAERKIVDRARHYARDRRDAAREVPVEELSERDLAGLLGTYRGFFTPSRHATAREELERAERAFARLPADYREVILLARVVGLTHAEIAERMGRSREAVWKLYSRALGRLSSLLGEDAPE